MSNSGRALTCHPNVYRVTEYVAARLSDRCGQTFRQGYLIKPSATYHSSIHRHTDSEDPRAWKIWSTRSTDSTLVPSLGRSQCYRPPIPPAPLAPQNLSLHRVLTMQTHLEKMKSDVDSTLNALVSLSPGISCTEGAQKIAEICNHYLKKCEEASVQPTGRAYDDEGEVDPYEGNSTPGVADFFSNLWGGVIERVYNAPLEEQTNYDHITHLIDLVGKVKENLQPEGDGWVIGGERCGWKDLPLLGQTIRDVFNEPIDTMTFKSALLLSPEGQATVAGASQPGSQVQHAMLFTRFGPFVLDSKTGLHLPPSCDAKCDTFEESPAFLALQVEAAAIWIRNTAPLMYRCTEIWGPDGNPEWPKRAGAPGRGGRRWDGVDGYDREHKRWDLWKVVLSEVIQWCDGLEKEKMQGWKMKEAASGALEAMKEAEQR
ncbi:hypothetical protein OPQ81_010414 [Rhizoctonia solani]|nr:hypothetical protein OPQ81_010414 [Rhizoctonia solani]